MSESRERLLSILRVDPRDTGCDHFFELLDEYAELILAGEDPERHLPGAAAHLAACGPCQQDLDGLLAAVGG